MALSKLTKIGLVTSIVCTSGVGIPSAAWAAQESGAVAQPQAAISPTIESSCGLLVLNGAVTELRTIPNLRVLNNESIRWPRFDSNVLAVSCNRDSVVPVPADSRVLKAHPKPFILNAGSRAGTLTLENGNFKYAISGGVLSREENTAVRAQLEQMRNDASAQERRKSGGNKALGCIGGGVLGGLLAGLLAPKQNRGAAVAVGFAAGCAVGWGFAKNWSQRDKDGLEDASHQAMDNPNGSMEWQAPESGSQVQFRTASAGEKSEDVEFQLADTVEAPQQGSKVVSLPYRAVSNVVLRSAPDNSSEGNVVGQFAANQTVEIVGFTPDMRWAMVGEDGIIVGYAERDQFVEVGQALRQVRTARHVAPARKPARPVIARRNARTPAAPVMAAQVAPAPVQPQVRTVKVAATTQCKSLTAATGQQRQARTGCNRPGGKWVFA